MFLARKDARELGTSAISLGSSSGLVQTLIKTSYQLKISKIFALSRKSS